MIGNVAHGEADDGNHGGNPSNNSSHCLLVHCKSQPILEFGYACIKETVSSITANIHNREIA
jgi:hypothetical protein